MVNLSYLSVLSSAPDELIEPSFFAAQDLLLQSPPLGHSTLYLQSQPTISHLTVSSRSIRISRPDESRRVDSADRLTGKVSCWPLSGLYITPNAY